MPLTSHDAIHLARALQLAQDAVALASPNPTVGCVLADGNVILGEGAHLYDARDHAEIAALKQASDLGHNVRGATAYVTLEPCSHRGRTGPCADALIAAGIARCVVATVDPNPLVSGSGIVKLRDADVEVLLIEPADTLAVQCRRLNDAFAWFIQHRRPFLTLKAAVSVDGKLAPPPSARMPGSPHWLTGNAARADVQQLRHGSDAILTGIGTVLADDPSLTDRTGLPRRRGLLRVVLDANLRIPPDAAIVTSAAPSPEPPDVLVFCSTGAAVEREAALLACNVDVQRLQAAADGRLDLHAALKHLAQRNILSVLAEAGSMVNASLLRADLVDKFIVYYTEHELGLEAVPFAASYQSPYAIQERLTRASRTAFPSDIQRNMEDIRVTGYLHDPWAAPSTNY